MKKQKEAVNQQEQIVKGYKVFNSNFTCRNFKFEVGKTYTHDGAIKICNSGFHFCIKASHCFSYYEFNSENIVCEVEALGDIQTHYEDSKVCTNKLKILRQLTWNEVLMIANEGKNNTGHSNTGDSNTGDRNTGYRNTGDRNTGYSNTGYSNTGDRNTGDSNTGDRNTGYSNTGDRNTGYRNTGDSNTGDRNTGDRNTGDRNTGYSNTGYSNTGDRNTGAFCTGEPIFTMFNKPSEWSANDFLESRAWYLIRNYVETKLWVPDSKMTDAEKKENRGWKTAEGYYKDIPYKEAFTNAWHNWSEENRKEFTSLPNFDAAIFEEITGVKI